MKSLAIFMLVAATLTTESAYADDDTVTQVGQWTCPVRNGENAPITCPKINFPTEFGNTPSVIVPAGCDGLGYPNSGPPFECWGPNAFSVQQITPQGFSIVSNVGGYWRDSDGDHATARQISGTWIAVGPKLLPGTVIPNYLVLTVIYAPPGTNGGKSQSSVSYGAGSSTGTTTSSSHTFKFANTISLEGKVNIGGNGGGGGVSFEASRSATDAQSLAIKKSSNSSISVGGPAQDGINHDDDEIWLLLKPSVNLAVSSSTAQWVLSEADSSSAVQFVTVGQLKGTQAIGTGLAAYLQSAGITPAEYPNILKHDPLANGSTALDPNRFVLVTRQIPYEPPGDPNQAPTPVSRYEQDNSSTTTLTNTTENSYTVGLTVSGSASYASLVTATLADKASWTWTDKSEYSTQAGTTQTASLSIGGPAFGYPGPTLLEIYFDTMYQTFAFVLVSPDSRELAVAGTLTTAAGAPIERTQVKLVQKGAIKQVTVTNAKGEFRFYGRIDGPATVEADGLAPQTINRPSTPVTVALRKQLAP